MENQKNQNTIKIIYAKCDLIYMLGIFVFKANAEVKPNVVLRAIEMLKPTVPVRARINLKPTFKMRATRWMKPSSFLRNQ